MASESSADAALEDGRITDRVPRICTSFEESISRAHRIGRPLLDSAYEPSNTRLRALGVTGDLHEGIAHGDLTSMGTTWFAEDGGSLRTFSGGLAHECGWWPSFVSHRLQHWEGIAALNFIIEAETDPRVDSFQTEGIGFHFYLPPRWYDYIADVLMSIGGVRHVIEIKRSERDLQDPEYRMKLAAVAEICRRCGWIFRIVLADEIYANHLHAQNCRLFTDRRFVRVERPMLARLENFAIRNGSDTTYGRLAEELAPGATPLGEALIQALVIRRRIEIDLTRRVYHHAELRIV
jgi:hypothetical protein